jgi:hypothetical protein
MREIYRCHYFAAANHAGTREQDEAEHQEHEGPIRLRLLCLGKMDDKHDVRKRTEHVHLVSHLLTSSIIMLRDPFSDETKGWQQAERRDDEIEKPCREDKEDVGERLANPMGDQLPDKADKNSRRINSKPPRQSPLRRRWGVDLQVFGSFRRRGWSLLMAHPVSILATRRREGD